jgi:hypothetical protein
MKRTVRPTRPGAARAVADSNLPEALGRIKLALMDDYLDAHMGEKRGYDPYDTSKDHAPDIWASKRKRA